MANFEDAAALLIQQEGGYVDDPDDPGGETKFGISKRSYPNVDIKNLTSSEAEAIYKRDFWNPLYGQIPQQIADKIVGLSLNDGKETSVRLLQTACGAIVDGVFGAVTLSAVLRQNPDSLLSELRALAAEHYALLLLDNPKLEKLMHGWMRRAVA